MRGVSDRPVSSGSRGDTAHAPLIQVATPSLGKTQRFKTIQATMNPIIIRTSDMVFFRSNPLHLAHHRIEYTYLSHQPYNRLAMQSIRCLSTSPTICSS
jgi:hypothetical protein